MLGKGMPLEGEVYVVGYRTLRTKDTFKACTTEEVILTIDRHGRLPLNPLL